MSQQEQMWRDCRAWIQFHAPRKTYTRTFAPRQFLSRCRLAPQREARRRAGFVTFGG